MGSTSRSLSLKLGDYAILECLATTLMANIVLAMTDDKKISDPESSCVQDQSVTSSIFHFYLFVTKCEGIVRKSREKSKPPSHPPTRPSLSTAIAS